MGDGKNDQGNFDDEDDKNESEDDDDNGNQVVDMKRFHDEHDVDKHENANIHHVNDTVFDVDDLVIDLVTLDEHNYDQIIS